MDVLSKDQRHRNMSNIKGKDTSIEVRLRKALWHKGYRYRKNYNHLPGKPDIVLTKYKNGKVKVNDPFSQKNSDKIWKYSKIKDQIKSLWVYKID